MLIVTGALAMVFGACSRSDASSASVGSDASTDAGSGRDASAAGSAGSAGSAGRLGRSGSGGGGMGGAAGDGAGAASAGGLGGNAGEEGTGWCDCIEGSFCNGDVLETREQDPLCGCAVIASRQCAEGCAVRGGVAHCALTCSGQLCPPPPEFGTAVLCCTASGQCGLADGTECSSPFDAGPDA